MWATRSEDANFYAAIVCYSILCAEKSIGCYSVPTIPYFVLYFLEKIIHAVIESIYWFKWHFCYWIRSFIIKMHMSEDFGPILDSKKKKFGQFRQVRQIHYFPHYPTCPIKTCLFFHLGSAHGFYCKSTEAWKSSEPYDFLCDVFEEC